jgi:SAM-dependent methyltransferase
MFYFKPNIRHELPKRSADNAFEDQYIPLRKKEQRLYSDAEVRRLPSISPLHPHYKEWISRKRSCNRLLKHLGKSKTSLRILEVGCGNGWLSHKLSTVKSTQVTGYDINQIELYQAKKVFGNRANLRFTAKDPFEETAMFDVIVFAASIQYFASLNEIISKSMASLQPGGRLHIIDTHFYEAGEVTAAQKRTEDYFASLGFADMSENYFHHSLDELKRFDYRILYNPGSFWNKLLKRKDPFYWVCIKKN